jgi:hypothetical protein
MGARPQPPRQRTPAPHRRRLNGPHTCHSAPQHPQATAKLLGVALGAGTAHTAAPGRCSHCQRYEGCAVEVDQSNGRMPAIVSQEGNTHEMK